jgi:hypothetical protein
MSVDSGSFGTWVGGIGFLIIVGWSLFTYYETTSEHRVPLNVQYLEAKMRGALPKEVAPGLKWFDIDIGRSTLVFSVKMDESNAEKFRKIGSQDLLNNFTNAFVCEWRNRELSNVDVVIVVSYYDNNKNLIQSVNNDNAICVKYKYKPKISI